MKAVIDDAKLEDKVFYVGIDNGANILKAFQNTMPGFITEEEFDNFRKSEEQLMQAEPEIDKSNYDCEAAVPFDLTADET